MLVRIIILSLRLLAYFPLPILHQIGSLSGYCLSVFPNHLRRISSINLRLCFPELSETKHKILLRNSLRELSKNILESGFVWASPSKKILDAIQSVDGGEAFNKALNSNQSIIVSAPHLGNWEVMGIYLSSVAPAAFMYRTPRIEAFDSIVRSSREQLGATLLPANTSGVRQLYKLAKKAHLIGILPDQTPREGQATYTKFFGIDALTMVLLSKLALKNQARVFTAFANRLPKGKGFQIIFTEVPEIAQAETLQKSVDALSQSVEDIVVKSVEQYQWSYRRFRRQPTGKRKIY